jgi:hypothetical protein
LTQGIIEQHCQSCNSAVDNQLTVLLINIHNQVRSRRKPRDKFIVRLGRAIRLLRGFCTTFDHGNARPVRAITLLRSNGRALTKCDLTECCQPCDSAGNHATALLTINRQRWQPCDSAVDNQRTGLSINIQCCQSCDSAGNHATALLTINGQRCRSIYGAVNHVTALSTMRQRCQLCDSAVAWLTALSVD